MVTWSPPQCSVSRVRNGLKQLDSSGIVRLKASSTQTRTQLKHFVSETNEASGVCLVWTKDEINELITSPEQVYVFPTTQRVISCLPSHDKTFLSHEIVQTSDLTASYPVFYLYVPIYTRRSPSRTLWLVKTSSLVRSEFVSNLFRGSRDRTKGFDPYHNVGVCQHVIGLLE